MFYENKIAERFWRSRLREHCSRTLRGMANLSSGRSKESELSNWNNGLLTGIIWNRYFQDQCFSPLSLQLQFMGATQFWGKAPNDSVASDSFCHPLTQFWYTSYLDDISCLHIPLEYWHLCSIETAVISIGRKCCSLTLAIIGNTILARPRRVS